MNNHKLQINRIVYLMGIVVLGITYFFILGDNGPYEMRDSKSFLNPSFALLQSYWLYPRFLGICKNIFGQDNFLYFVYLIQGILAISTSICMTEFFRKYFNTNYRSAFLIYVFTLLPYGYSLPENVVTHHIMTEALSIPLFHICILFACKSFLANKKYYMLLTGGVGILLVLSRPQLLVCIPVIAFFFLVFFGKEFLIKLASIIKIKRETLIVFVVLIAGIVLVVLGYGVFSKTTIGSQFLDAISGRVMCLMEYEDRHLFEGEMQELYDTLYRNADEGGHLKKYFRTDSWRSYDIAEHTNENTKEGLAVIREFHKKKYPESNPIDYLEKSFQDRDTIIGTVLSNHIGDYVIMSIQLMMQSFVASVFIQPDSIRNLCYVITFIIYCAVFFLMYIAERKMRVERKYIIPMLITQLFLFTNVILTNIVFYGQQRYVVYTFGMFYISFFIIILGIYRKRKEQMRSEKSCKCYYSNL